MKIVLPLGPRAAARTRCVGWFVALLATAPALSAQQVTRGPYLQRGTPDSVVVRWRTDVETDSRVRYGLFAEGLPRIVGSSALTTEHEVALFDLTPDTQYFYSIGSSTTQLASGADHAFVTSPPSGTVKPTRVWILGDSGTANINAMSVRDAYKQFAGGRYTDVWLMLGDNAYNTGTDAEYQRAVFDMYPEILRQSVLWPTIGNHDTAFSINPPESLPYFNIFTLPKEGEAGGAPSGTEKYYSFDYGRIHFICLDSMSSSRAPGSPMLTWLQSDLESTTQDGIIAYWHHPPYTKGSHNSDTEFELIQMRENVLPILEAGGVDLVLTGHSHCYERSFLLDGHYGSSNTLTESMKLDGGSGRADGDGAYVKAGALAANQGAVYVVAGSSGQVSFWTNGTAAEVNPAPHPAKFISLLHLGSLILDIDRERLDAKFLRNTGGISDYFSIVKNIPNQPPVVTITAPREGAEFNLPAFITITAAAADLDGSIAQVDFYAGDQLIGSDTAAPFAVAWSGLPLGESTLTATATDDRGATVTSAPVHVRLRRHVPAAPSNLSATVVGRNRIDLAWTDNANTERNYRLQQSRDGISFTHVATLGRNRTSFSRTRLRPDTTYYFRVRAGNRHGSTSSNVASARTAP